LGVAVKDFHVLGASPSNRGERPRVAIAARANYQVVSRIAAGEVLAVRGATIVVCDFVSHIVILSKNHLNMTPSHAKPPTSNPIPFVTVRHPSHTDPHLTRSQPSLAPRKNCQLRIRSIWNSVVVY